MVSNREKSVGETTCLPLDYRNEDSDRSQAGLENQDTPKLFPSEFPISVIICSVVQAKPWALFLTFLPHHRVSLVIKPCVTYFLNIF